MARILFGVTAPNTALAFLDGQLGYLTDRGHDVHLMCPRDSKGSVEEMCLRETAEFHATSSVRKPSLSKDFATLLRAANVLREVRPDIVVAGTPKMSLIMLLCARVFRVNHRVYLCHGLRFEGMNGLARKALALVELLFTLLSTDVVAVSPSVKEGLIGAGAAQTKISVLGAGSPNGVDTSRFSPPSPDVREMRRRALGLECDAFVILFVGRLTRDKGIRALLALARAAPPEATILVAGAPEPSDDDDREVLQRLKARPNVRLLGRIESIEHLYEASDVLVLPTRREGLPTVVIEAGAVGVPTVAMCATGTVDAIRHDVTGLLTPQGDVDAFANALVVHSRSRFQTLGTNARHFVVENFDRPTVWRGWADYLERLVNC